MIEKIPVCTCPEKAYPILKGKIEDIPKMIGNLGYLFLICYEWSTELFGEKYLEKFSMGPQHYFVVTEKNPKKKGVIKIKLRDGFVDIFIKGKLMGTKVTSKVWDLYDVPTEYLANLYRQGHKVVYVYTTMDK